MEDLEADIVNCSSILLIKADAKSLCALIFKCLNFASIKHSKLLQREEGVGILVISITEDGY